MDSAPPLTWRGLPALLLAGLFAAGIAVAEAVPGISFWGWTGAGLSGLIPLGGGWRYGRRRLVSPFPLLRTLGVGLMVTGSGGAAYRHALLLPPSHILFAASSPPGDASVLLEGRVLKPPQPTPYGLRVIVAAQAVTQGQQREPVAGKVQVSLFPRQRGGARAALPFPPVQEGDLLEVRGRLRRVPARRNPAEFDYRAYLARQGIHATLTVTDVREFSLKGRHLNGAERLVVPIRRLLYRQLERYVAGPDARAVLQALVLGDRSRLEPGQREQFARTGLAHLLAVSGLHVLLVGMVLYGLLGPLLTRAGVGWATTERLRTGATVTVLALYMLVTGSSPSVVRAVLMAALFMGGVLLQRGAPALNTLGVAACLLLAWKPVHLFDVGFQLSFSAVGGILVLRPVLAGWVPASWSRYAAARWAASMTAVSAAATLGTMPVLLVHFGRVALAGLVLNLPAIPLTTLLLTSGLGVVVTGAWLPGPAAAFGAAADVLAEALLWTAAAGDDMLGWASLAARPANGWFTAALAAPLLAMACWRHPRLRWRCCTAFLLLLVAGMWTEVEKGAFRARLEVVFLDVGQGDAALVRLPNGRHLLVDAGRWDPERDAGRRVLLPHLAHYGIRRLDAVVITHPHSDHLGGLASLLRSMEVGHVFHNGQPYASARYAEALHVIDSLGVPHLPLTAGDTLQLDPAVRIHVLAPRPEGWTEPNDASVVLRLQYGDTAFLLAGDAEADAEGWLVDRYGPLLASTLVKVGHHGSRTSSTPAFVHRVLPDTTASTLAVVSVAARNLYGLPNPEVLARWTARGATVWTTAAEGAVWIRSDGRRLARRRWR